MAASPENPSSCLSRRYRWLLFDADGTLFDYDRAESLALARALQHFGVTFVPAHLTAYQEINGALWRALEQGKTTPEILKVRRFELLLERFVLGMSVSNSPPPDDSSRCRAPISAVEFSTFYLDSLAACSELIEGAEEVLRMLSGRYQCAILTNGLQAVQRSRVERSAIRDCIATLIISEEIECAKPDASFFDAARSRIGNPPKHEMLMIGDSWTSDILGASRYGIDTCWYNPSHKPRPESPELTWEIASLKELIGLLL